MAFLVGGNGFVSLQILVPELFRIVSSEAFWLSASFTVVMTVLGLVAGTVVGLIVGAPMGLSRFLDLSSRGTVNFVRAIPTVVLLPLLLASQGSRISVVVTLVVLAVSLKMVVYVSRGLRDISSNLVDQGKIFHLNPFVVMGIIRLPAASAIIVSGIRQSVNRAYGAVILAGFIAGTPGFGNDINLASLRGSDASLLGYVVIAGVISILLYRLTVMLESRVVTWRVSA